ncbi:MAG: DUF4105 domain-containing protein [Anaeromyxobacter sp.]
MPDARGGAAHTALILASLLAGAPAPTLAQGVAPVAPPPEATENLLAPPKTPAPPSAGAEARPPGGDPAYLPELVARAREERLAEDVGWLRLLHYRSRLGGGWESEVDGPAFFRAPDGKKDPAAELEATLAGFFDATPHADELDDAQCRFPARLRWLADHLDIDFGRLALRPCPRRDTFLQRIHPMGVTLVFSSYYLNNPASAFGHTLLRFDKAQEAIGGKHFELLDLGVDYAATVDTPNALAYAFKGLFGFFKGEFKAYAYYYKVREYGDFESRDLWEYDLDLTPGELALLADHVWELGGTYLWYWYLDENCSYHVLGALEAAAPRLQLLRHVGRYVVLPSDTVHALFANPGLVRRTHYRPSLRTQFAARVAPLDGEAQALVERLAGEPSAPLPEALPPERQVAVLDASADLLDLRHARELLLGKDPVAAAQRQELLQRRAALALPSAPLDVPIPDDQRPERGHGSMRLGAGAAAVEGEGAAAVLDLRLALHDLGDPPLGFPPLSQNRVPPHPPALAPARAAGGAGRRLAGAHPLAQPGGAVRPAPVLAGADGRHHRARRGLSRLPGLRGRGGRRVHRRRSGRRGRSDGRRRRGAPGLLAPRRRRRLWPAARGRALGAGAGALRHGGRAAARRALALAARRRPRDHLPALRCAAAPPGPELLAGARGA